jgi:hypothetical protein
MELRFEFIKDFFLFAVNVFGGRSGANGVLDGSWRVHGSMGRFGTHSKSVQKPAVQPPIRAEAFIK